jgi:hypothetical protein
MRAEGLSMVVIERAPLDPGAPYSPALRLPSILFRQMKNDQLTEEESRFNGLLCV